MAIQVKHKVVVQNSLDTDQKRKLFFQDDDGTAEVVLSDFLKQMSSNLNVPVSTLEALTFGDVAAVRGFYMEVDGDCTVRFNGASTGIPVALGKNATRAKVLIEATITAITVENLNATTEVTGVYCVWGDPTA